MIFINIISSMNKIFTTREQAMIIWFAITFIFCMKNKSIRNSLKDIVELIIKLLLKIPGMVMITYIIILGCTLNKIGYLQSTIIKDYIFWSIFGLIPIINTIVSKYKTITVLEILREVVKFSIVPLFIINTYTMSLLSELIIIPISVMCTMGIVMCDSKEEYKAAKNVFNFVIIAIFIVMIYVAIKGFIINVNDLKDITFWEGIAIDIVCIIGYIPLIVYFRWYLLYEQIGMLIGFRSKLNKCVIYLITLKNCLFIRKKLVCILENINEFYRIENWRDLDSRIKQVLDKVYNVA
ncbi:hypothetical protein QOZ84_07005 [Romboutsia sedimentorum]|uniref:Uncharacterized protein n=1 Tax=Romboutsia sedimentorum TaxID=1368474 RepID=A0ABT7E8S9_9FIRM|nr:hypothetical protein [Romboutsia sedimentorum]MDK2563292.1 hypothetical protein [Romboutsia sedimentorum]